jgi:uncharacterized membrane protein YfcA
MTVLLFVLGTAIAGYGTLIGAGGGFLLVPALLFLFPTTEPAVLTSLSLSIVALNALSGSIAYARAKRIDLRVAGVLSIAAVPGTMVGARLTTYVPRHLFEAAFGAILLALAAFLVWKPLSPAVAEQRELGTAVPPAPAPGRLDIGVVLSALVGVVAGLLGIGGSPLQVIVLTHVMHLPVHIAMPTSQFMVLLGALGGVAVHVVSGDFHVGWVPFVLLGSGAIFGAQIGAALSLRMSGTWLIRLLAGALLIVGVRLLIGPLL